MELCGNSTASHDCGTNPMSQACAWNLPIWYCYPKGLDQIIGNSSEARQRPFFDWDETRTPRKFFRLLYLDFKTLISFNNIELTSISSTASTTKWLCDVFIKTWNCVLKIWNFECSILCFLLSQWLCYFNMRMKVVCVRHDYFLKYTCYGCAQCTAWLLPIVHLLWVCSVCDFDYAPLFYRWTLSKLNVKLELIYLYYRLTSLSMLEWRIHMTNMLFKLTHMTALVYFYIQRYFADFSFP